MRTFRCVCNNILYFDNSLCLACHREVGFCPECDSLNALLPQAQGGFQCGNGSCGVQLLKCTNYASYNVCNRCVVIGDTSHSGFCDCCRFNDTIPDLTVVGNLEKWYRLEAAKRRLFYDLRKLGLPYGTAQDGIDPPLSFDFKADVIPPNDIWRGGNQGEKVFTSHDRGRITINIREADSVARESLRVEMRETHRSLIGHFRHEIGHYYWDVLVLGRDEAGSKAVFGDHENPTYDQALGIYYQNGAPPNWQENFISEYSTMHPWEDFAETWAAYLDMCGSLDTAENVGFRGESDPVHANFDAMVARYQQIGIATNELNRNMGILDAVPQVFVQPVIAKMRYIHGLVQRGRAENLAIAGTAVPIQAATALN